MGEVDGFQEVGMPTHVRLPAVTAVTSAQRRSSSPASSPYSRIQGPAPYRAAPRQDQQSIFDSFRDTLFIVYFFFKILNAVLEKFEV